MRKVSSLLAQALRTAFVDFRERARLLAAEIPRDLPDFTVHDISHIDALWEMAELVAGPDYHLTPTEAFVLGGAFLIHDLGMGLAAYPEGIEALRRERGWRDTLAAVWQPELNRVPNPAELDEPPAEVERLAVGEMLRTLHAQRAERLALTSWQTDEGETYHLIDNSQRYP